MSMLKVSEGYRKLFFSLFVFLVCTVLVWRGVIPADAFESITWGTLMAFAGGNFGEHWARKSDGDPNNR